MDGFDPVVSARLRFPADANAERTVARAGLAATGVEPSVGDPVRKVSVGCRTGWARGWASGAKGLLSSEPMTLRWRSRSLFEREEPGRSSCTGVIDRRVRGSC